MTDKIPDRPIHIVVAVTLSEAEYNDLMGLGPRRSKGATAPLTGPGTLSAAIRSRMGWHESPRGIHKHPEVISKHEYRLRQGGTVD
jgi:hypothetical protein